MFPSTANGSNMNATANGNAGTSNGHYNNASGTGSLHLQAGNGVNGSIGAAPGNANAAGGSGSAAAGSSTGGLIYPALHLQPLNDTFAPKQICLAPPGPQNKIKIGRQTNNKTVPQPSNGYFDSKVLSRMHAEVWSQDGKVYIKDVKSSNGTFINGSRLSAEGQESDVFELHTDDVVEFGIDIVGEDNKTIIHHKVACRVFLVMTAEEALGLRHDFAALYRGGIAGSTLNHHVVGPGAEGGLRRSKMGTGGGYGSNGGTNVMSFDHILHKLQAELQKSRETAGELGSLNAAMLDIGETLGGGLPPMQNPPYQHLVPSSNTTDPAAAAREEEQRQQRKDELSAQAAELKMLEERVKETQLAMQAQVERLALFESRLDDNEGIKAEIQTIQEQVRDARSDAAEARFLLASKKAAAHDDDDAASVVSVDTVVPQDVEDSSASLSVGNAARRPVEIDEGIGHIGDLNNVDEDEEARDAATQRGITTHDMDLLRRLKEHIGPLAPADDITNALDRNVDLDRSRNEELMRRLEAMENQLERALELGRTLADQHAEANDNVRKLEERIRSLETEKSVSLDTSKAATKTDDVRDAVAIKEEPGLPEGTVSGEAGASNILGILEAKWGKWREAFEADFAKQRAGLHADRDDLRRVVRMWDTLNQEVEDLVEGAQTDDGGNGDDATPSSRSTPTVATPTTPQAPVQAAGGGGNGGGKRRRKKKGGNQFGNTGGANAAIHAHQPGMRRTTSAVGLGTAADLNRHLRALIYTDEYNIMVRETHMDSESSTSASSSMSDTSRSATSKITDDTSVSSAASVDHKGKTVGETGGGATRSLDDLPDGVRKRAMAHLAAGRRKGAPAAGRRWTDFGTGAGGPLHDNNPAHLHVLGAAGVVFVGMTAWVMAGKGSFNLGGGGAGGFGG